MSEGLAAWQPWEGLVLSLHKSVSRLLYVQGQSKTLDVLKQKNL